MATAPPLYPAALAMWNILEAVAEYVDRTYSPLHPGLITIEKLEAAASDAGDDVSTCKYHVSSAPPYWTAAVLEFRRR